MTIAILGWGSLVWNSRELRIVGDWHIGGPVLPLEFSRLSSGGRLTLVVDEENGVDVETLFARSAVEDLKAAIGNLQSREGMPTSRRVGVVVCRQPVSSFVKSLAVQKWAKLAGFDAAIWTALESNF